MIPLRAFNCLLTNNTYNYKLLLLRSLKNQRNPKCMVEIDESISMAIENKELKPRRHPGIMKIKITELPVIIVKSMQKVLKDHPLKTLFGEGEALARYLLARHSPMEGNELKSKIAVAQESVRSESKIDITSLTEEQHECLIKKYDNKVKVKLMKTTYAWKPIEYDEYTSMQYLVGRSAAEYAVITKILTELKIRIPDFKPRTIFDFGSGVGTVSWASKSLWGDSIQEYFNVDTSVHMNDLASLLLREGNLNQDLRKGIFYRQFLPTSKEIRYDIVVSAYSLLELPTSQSRLETVLNLWNKSQGYLVLVEQGTNAGFCVINEAREFILLAACKTTSAHVFSPCPHDLACPRLSTSRPCNFQVSYHPLSLENKTEIKRERFSYVVLKKGPRSEIDPQWPRLVSETIVRSKHSICRMCHSDGNLQEVIFTASKQGKIPYHCARSSTWGDLLPMNIKK